MSEVQEHNRTVVAAWLNDLKSVQQRLHVGRSTVFALVASGELRSVKIGRRRLVPESALMEFIDGLQGAVR